MANTNQQNFSKDRKPEDQKRFEAADNAGRFSGNDQDARQASDQFSQNVDLKEKQSGTPGPINNDEPSDWEARRDPAQTHDTKGDAQNIRDESIQTLNEQELQKAKNKATEGRRQGREDRS